MRTNPSPCLVVWNPLSLNALNSCAAEQSRYSGEQADLGGYLINRSLLLKETPKLAMGRGVIGEKWSQRILWLCAIGTAVSLYMVAVERQAQNREKMLAEHLKAMESGESNGENV